MCIPRSSIRDNLIKEKPNGGLVGYFGIENVLVLVSGNYFWPHIHKDVIKFVQSFQICQVAKGSSQNIRLYTPLIVPTRPWEEISKDFLLGLPKTSRFNDSIFVIMDRFSNITHIKPCKKKTDVVHLVESFFKETVRLHGLPKSIVLDRDNKFIGYFWRILWKKINIELKFSYTFHPQTDGQTKVVNRILVNLLRCLVGKKGWKLGLSSSTRRVYI